MPVCKYPDCDCHFGYQEEGSDNCPQLRDAKRFWPKNGYMEKAVQEYTKDNKKNG